MRSKDTQDLPIGAGRDWPASEAQLQERIAILHNLVGLEKPVLAALWVMVAAWKRDRRLSVAALIALAGLVVVFFVKGLLA